MKEATKRSYRWVDWICQHYSRKKHKKFPCFLSFLKVEDSCREIIANFGVQSWALNFVKRLS